MYHYLPSIAHSFVFCLLFSFIHLRFSVQFRGAGSRPTLFLEYTSLKNHVRLLYRLVVSQTTYTKLQGWGRRGSLYVSWRWSSLGVRSLVILGLVGGVVAERGLLEGGLYGLVELVLGELLAGRSRLFDVVLGLVRLGLDFLIVGLREDVKFSNSVMTRRSSIFPRTAPNSPPLRGTPPPRPPSCR